jgi:hypothetical protein
VTNLRTALSRPDPSQFKIKLKNSNKNNEAENDHRSSKRIIDTRHNRQSYIQDGQWTMDDPNALTELIAETEALPL